MSHTTHHRKPPHTHHGAGGTTTHGAGRGVQNFERMPSLNEVAASLSHAEVFKMLFKFQKEMKV